MIQLKKIKASAMQFAILVASLVAILLSSFLLLTHTHRFFSLQSDMLTNTVSAAQKGIDWSLDAQNKVIDSVVLSQEQTVTTISKRYWGGYLKMHSRSKTKSKEFEKVALVGSSTNLPRTAIHLSNNLLPLVMVGDAEIEGDCHLSDKGVKAGVIEGNYFKGESLNNGTIKRSSGVLPRLDSQWQLATKEFLETLPEFTMIVEQGKDISNSFLSPVKTIYSPEAIVVTDKIAGYVNIKSDRAVQITSSAQLTDVLIVAPKVTIESGFKGNIHVIADKQIQLEKGVKLSYPSSLVLLDSNDDPRRLVVKGEEPIFIDSNSNVEGTIIYLSDMVDNPFSNVAISVSDQSLIRGSVYSNTTIELYGTVEGNVYAENFITRASGGRYINHLFNGKVLSQKLPLGFCGLPFEDQKKGVVQWLY